MAITMSALTDWITSLGWDITEETGAPIKYGPYMGHSEPDKVIIITPTPGPGYVMEGFADVSGFQIRTRGQQGADIVPAQTNAESLAYQIDAMIEGALFPAIVDAKKIIHIHRFGGVPTPLGGDPDDAGRFSYVCSYLCFTGTA
jgi:hypothetical protein